MCHLRYYYNIILILFVLISDMVCHRLIVKQIIINFAYNTHIQLVYITIIGYNCSCDHKLMALWSSAYK